MNGGSEDGSTLPIQDFPLHHHAGHELLGALRCTSMSSVARRGGMPHGFCYWNVRRRCERFGGMLQLGWMITWLPGIYIQAMHHGVWRQKDGSVIDPTCPPPSMVGEGHSTFVHDDRHQVDLSFPVLIANRHVLLVNDEVVRHWSDENRRKSRASQRLCVELKRSGRYSWSPEFGMAGPPLGISQQRQVEKIRRSNTELLRLNRELADRHRQSVTG